MPGIARTLSRARNVADGLATRLRTARSLPVLAALCVVQVAIAAWFALETPHNGWVWYSGGDATEYWTSEWAVAHRWLTQTIIGWGLPVLYAWAPLVSGTTLLSALPVVVVFQMVVLVPLVVVLLWLVADRLFGRVYAWSATILWIIGPLLLLAGMRHDYRLQFEQEFLAPHVYGLTNMADLPSVVATLATAWATLRALDRDRAEEWLFAGLLGGVAIGIKPANAYLIVAVALLLVLRSRLRGAAVFAAALAPSLVVLAVWKSRGVGKLPLFAVGVTREAAGRTVGAIVPKRYLPWNPHHLHVEFRALMEVFWSVRLLQFIAIAGAIAVIRRAPAKGAFVAVWFALFCVIKGSSEQANTTDTTYFRLTEPGLPAYVLLAAALVYLLPRRGRPWASPSPAPRQIPRWALVVTAVFGAVLPLALVPSLRRQPASFSTVRDNVHAVEAPLDSAWAATAGQSTLAWPAVPGHGSRVHYVVYRATDGLNGCTPPPSGAPECYLDATAVTTTEALSVRVEPGTYRVAAAANYLGAPNGSDLMLLGPPVTVR